jgi:phosphoketolase
VLSHACGAAFDNPDLIDKPVIFDFHGYPRLIHRLVYRRTNHNNMHVRGKGQDYINTPPELALENEIGRFQPGDGPDQTSSQIAGDLERTLGRNFKTNRLHAELRFQAWCQSA